MSTKDRKSLLIMDGVALQGALRAALAVAPSSGETACVWLQIVRSEQPSVFVCANDPKNHMLLAAFVPAVSVDLVDERDDCIIVSIPTVRELLAMKVKKPRDDEPWPNVAWEITEDRITQSDAGVIFGRVFKVKRESPAVYEAVSVPEMLAERVTEADARGFLEYEDWHIELEPAQVKRIGAAMANVGVSSALIECMPPRGNQSSCTWVRADDLSILAWTLYEEPEAATSGPEADSTVTAEVLELPSARQLVAANPPKGFA